MAERAPITSFTIDEAAAYLGITVGQFRRAVDRGELPKPFVRCRPQRWSKIQIDWALEGKTVSGPSSDASSSVKESLRALRNEVRR